VFVGIDAPDFNLGLERTLKQHGIRTVHYVSPSIWAWRQGRAAKIGRSADQVLCLFPTEPPIYAAHGVDARFVGHPLAEMLALEPDREAARQALALDGDAPVLAVLPGSRLGEIARLGEVFLDAAARVAAARQSREVTPQPQQAGPRGSLWRSTPMTVGSFLYRLASICQSEIHRFSEYFFVYQSSDWASVPGR